MRTNDAPTRRRKSQATTPRRQGRLRSWGESHVTISALTLTLISVVCVMIFCANTVSSQNLRRQMRIQRKIDRKTPRPAGDRNKLTPSDSGNEEPGAPDQPEAAAPRVTGRQPGNSVDGIRQRGLQSFFTQEEQSLWIPAFGNRAALLMIFRQLDLTPEQKIKIRDLRRQVGNRLRLSRQELNQLEMQLDEAIYGNPDPASLDSYDPAKVKELTEQVVQKRAEFFKLHTDIESQFRQILTPDQFYVYRQLMVDVVRPGNRPLVNPGARQQQRQRRMGVQPNSQNRPNQQDQPDGN
jgi:Spy/CpxP family protein refolding chaperone